MAFYFTCKACQQNYDEKLYIEECERCKSFLCKGNTRCKEAHDVRIHNGSTSDREQQIPHVTCTQCGAEGYNSDMCNCETDHAKLCSARCFNAHIRLHHNMNEDLAPGTFRAGHSIYIAPTPAPRLGEEFTADILTPIPATITATPITPVTSTTPCNDCGDETPNSEIYPCQEHVNHASDVPICRNCRYQCEYCETLMCEDCLNEHSCEDRFNCNGCEDNGHMEDAHTCDICDNIFHEDCYEEHTCPNKRTCDWCEEDFHDRDTVRQLNHPDKIFCTSQCADDYRHENPTELVILEGPTTQAPPTIQNRLNEETRPDLSSSHNFRPQCSVCPNPIDTPDRIANCHVCPVCPSTQCDATCAQVHREANHPNFSPRCSACNLPIDTPERVNNAPPRCEICATRPIQCSTACQSTHNAIQHTNAPTISVPF